jgi:hypothetical protein
MERKTTSFGMDRRTLVAGMAAVPLSRLPKEPSRNKIR